MAKRCMYPSCYAVVRDGTSRCEKHTKSKKQESQKNRIHNDNPETRKIYNSQRWRRLSKKYRIVNPLCEKCLLHNINSYANVVDHIKELSDGGDPYSWYNLMSLCHSCHNLKTSTEKRNRFNSL